MRELEKCHADSLDPVRLRLESVDRARVEPPPRKKYIRRRVGTAKLPTLPLALRARYVADRSALTLSRALRLFTLGEGARRLSVVADLKRQSPTARALPRAVAAFSDAV